MVKGDGRAEGCLPHCALPETWSSESSVAPSLTSRSLLKRHGLREASLHILAGGECPILNISQPASTPVRCWNKASTNPETQGASRSAGNTAGLTWLGFPFLPALSLPGILFCIYCYFVVCLWKENSRFMRTGDLADFILPAPGIVLGHGSCCVRVCQVHESRHAS